MATLSEVSDWIRGHLPALLEQYDVPGAAVAVLADGEVVDHAAGVLSLATGVEATTDSLFQIGSITKMWTGSLVMQLVDEGAVDLDAPLRSYLPGFRIADEEAATRITIRHLLTHTAGFEGDIFTGTGVGDDCLEKYVGVLHDVPQLFAPGAMWSYNNAGFSLLGRVVEVLRGAPYDACLREHLIAPLGITHAATSPYEAVLFRTASGHVRPAPDAAYRPTDVWALERSLAAAGSMFATSARGLLAFARMHLEDGCAPDGTQVLRSGTAARMREREVGLPELGHFGDSWGLATELLHTRDGQVVGHRGETIGQTAFLRMVPATGVAVALLANGGETTSLYADVVGHALRELSGLELPALPRPAGGGPNVDVTRYVGRYSCELADLVVSRDDDARLWLDDIPTDKGAGVGEIPWRTQLTSYRDDTFIALTPDRGLHRLYAFLDDDGAGHAKYLHSGRALLRSVD